MGQQVILKIQIIEKVVLKLLERLWKKSKEKSFYSVAGGGDTIAVLNLSKTRKYLNFSSTAGGAFLEYLEGKELPGIKALN